LRCVLDCRLDQPVGRKAHSDRGADPELALQVKLHGHSVSAPLHRRELVDAQPGDWAAVH